MDGFPSQFDTHVKHLYLLHGVDCTYSRGVTSWTVRLIPHIGDQYQMTTKMAGRSGILVMFRAMVSSSDSRLTSKTASQTFITPQLRDMISFSGDNYTICKAEGLERGWRYMNDRRNQIEISTIKSAPAEDH